MQIDNQINFMMLAKDNETKKRYRVKALDFITGTALVEIDHEIKEISLNEIRLLAYTRKRDVNGRRLFEHTPVEITKANGKILNGIIININGYWHVKDYFTKTTVKINKDDKIVKLHKKVL